MYFSFINTYLDLLAIFNFIITTRFGVVEHRMTNKINIQDIESNFLNLRYQQNRLKTFGFLSLPLLNFR